MFTELFTELGLTKNEAKIYETLLKFGESSISTISTEAAINRRNVYDSLDRLMQKGLVFEIKKKSESRYQAVEPKKLMESVREKELALTKALPQLEAMFKNKEPEQAVYIYRGVEGWKNYLRDILRIGEDVYTIGGKSSWTDPKLMGFFKSFVKQAEEKKIKFFSISDFEIKAENREILRTIKVEHKFLPKEFSTKAGLDVFGNRIVIVSVPASGKIDENAAFVVIVNQEMANAFRVWFKFMWGNSELGA